MTAALGEVDILTNTDGVVTATVQGRNRLFIVDRTSTGGWFCTCRYTSNDLDKECSHIRRVKEATGKD